jgi:hypothetical protein
MQLSVTVVPKYLNFATSLKDLFAISNVGGDGKNELFFVYECCTQNRFNFNTKSS